MSKHIIVETMEDYENRTKNYKEGINFLEVLAIAVVIGGLILLNFNVFIGIVVICVGFFWVYLNYKKARKRILRQIAKYKEY